ncbi:MAG: hypothetical protein AAFV90_11240 [Cyanobacteria bacterium J06634_5]
MSDVLQSVFQGKMLVFYNARSWESAQSRPAIAPTLIRNKNQIKGKNTSAAKDMLIQGPLNWREKI